MSDVEAGRVFPRGENPTRRRVVLVFVGLLLAVPNASLNQTPWFLRRCQPPSASSAASRGWFTAYLLASKVSTSLWGRLGGLYGREPGFWLLAGASSRGGGR